jgi:molybdopterin synthase catalytic subunit
MFSIVDHAIDSQAVSRVARSGDGGVVTFYGVVRDRDDDGRTVTALLYEAYVPMAIAEFEAIAREACERFGDVAFGIVHRIGSVPAGEVSVAVCAAAPHRESAFKACAYAIDELKRRAPIWKKEHYGNAAPEWKANARGAPTALPTGGAEVRSTGAPVKPQQ